MTLSYSVLSFLGKDNMVQTKESIAKFSQKWHCAVQFSIFSEKTTWLKPSSLFLNIFKNDIPLFGSQLSMKGQNGSNRLVYF